MSIFK
ncbi:hypothetical protein Zm00014a_013152 [Zea mays]